MSVPINIEINGINKLLNPDKDIEEVFNCFLIEMFCKELSGKELVRSEKMILFFLLKEIPFQCVVIRTEQLAIFKEAIKMYSIAYHAIEHVCGSELQVIFFRDADSVSFNEVIRNNNIEIIENLGSIKSEDPDIERHEKTALLHLNDDELMDFFKLFKNYLDDGGTIEECESYMKNMAAGPLFETLLESGRIRGVKFKELTVQPNDPELKDLDPDSEMKGGRGSTNYFERSKQIKMQADATPTR